MSQRRARAAFRALLRIAILLCCVVAAIALVAESGEYPGATMAGRRAALRDVLPLALVAWANLAALSVPTRWTLGIALLADAALLVTTAPNARPGAPPVSLALPAVAALLLIGVCGTAWARRASHLARR